MPIVIVALQCDQPVQNENCTEKIVVKTNFAMVIVRLTEAMSYVNLTISKYVEQKSDNYKFSYTILFYLPVSMFSSQFLLCFEPFNV